MRFSIIVSALAAIIAFKTSAEQDAIASFKTSAEQAELSSMASKIDEANKRYNQAIAQLEASCKSLKPYTTAKSTAEQFCSPSPMNNISVRFCIYQNLIDPDNEHSIALKSSNTYGSTTTTISANFPCKDIKV